MSFLKGFLFPLIWLLGAALALFHDLSGSYGVAILLLSLSVFLVTMPLACWARKIELRDKEIHAAMAPRLADVKSRFKGEQRFLETEKIYKEFGYHPVHSIKSSAGIAVQLPFLIASLLLLVDYPFPAQTGFLFVPDLSQADGLLTVAGVQINLLPLLMMAVTLIETVIKPEMGKAAKTRFFLITMAIVVLIYNLPAAVVLYWISNNLLSLGRCVLRLQKLK